MKRSPHRIVKIRLAKLIKPVLVAALVVVVGMILVYMVLHLRRRPSLSPEKKELAQQKIEVQEKVDFFDFKGKLKVKAVRRYLGEDNLYHLVGPVEIIDQGKKGGGEISIAGESVVYDKDWKHFAIQGQVKVRVKDALVESETADYDREKGIFRTETGVLISSPRFSGSAKRAAYSLIADEISLEGDVEFKMIPRLEDPQPLEVKNAEKLVYISKWRTGRIESKKDELPLSLVHGKSRGTAELVEFEQFAVDDNLRVLFLRGRVKIFLEEKEKRETEKKEKDPEGHPLSGQVQAVRKTNFFQSEKQEIEAEEIKLIAFLNSSQLHAIESKGQCSFKFISAAGDLTQVRGEAVDFVFNRDGKLREFRVKDKARIADFQNGSGPARAIEGAAMILNGETQVLHVWSGDGGSARFISAKNEVTGQEIEILTGDDSFYAYGGATAILRLQTETSATMGFFARDKPVFANSRSMRYSTAEKRFLLSEQVKLWQDKAVLLGQEFFFNEETGEMQGAKDIKSIFPHTPKGGEKEGRVEISADKMSYDPKANQMIYEGGKDRCSLIMRNIILRAGLITVLPGEEAGKVRSMRAMKSVTITQEAREAVGETAEYEVEKDTLVLTGRPVLTIKDKGTVRGDKLTFRLGDGTILVENPDQQRSVAVIKS